MRNIIFFIVSLFLLGSCKNADSEKETEEAKKEAWETVKTINSLWAEKEDTDSLKLFFHDKMVLIAPSPFERFEGKDLIVDSYKSYLEIAEILFFTESNPKVDLYNENRTAVVCYDFHTKIYFTGKDTIESKGRDMYVLIKEDGRWVAVADQFSSVQ